MPLPEGLPDAALILPLSRMARNGARDVSELKLREPTLGEVYEAEGEIQIRTDPEARTLYLRKLVAGVTGLPGDLLDEVLLADLRAAHQHLARFIDAGLEEVENPDENWTIPLDAAIEHAGASHCEIALQAPTTGQVRRAQGQLRKGVGPQSLRSQQIWLISHVSGVPYEVVKRLPVSTGNAAMSYLAGF